MHKFILATVTGSCIFFYHFTLLLEFLLQFLSLCFGKSIDHILILSVLINDDMHYYPDNSGPEKIIGNKKY